jgi:chemotaxis protein methyltransferase CheR
MASGEEAYSLAMTLLTYAPGLELSVLGTDINQTALRAAERARYGQHSLRVPSLLLDAFLWPQPGGDFIVSPEVQRLVSFRQLNLRDPLFQLQFQGHEAFDIIFCRNVLVYFAPALVPQVLGRLRDCLSEGGYLCVSALDCTVQISGLEPMSSSGMNFLRRVLPSRRTPTDAPQSRLTPSLIPQAVPVRRTGPDQSGPVTITPGINNAITSAFSAARAAADKGQLDRADAIAQDALTKRRTPEALHLLALIRGERGQTKEMEALLIEAVEHNPGYVLGHLSLGLLDRPRQERWRSAHHLNTVLNLLRSRRDEETLQGPECLQVAMARRLALAGLENLERRP